MKTSTTTTQPHRGNLAVLDAPPPRERVQRGEFITVLDAYFGNLTDAQIIQDINLTGTIRRWASENLLPLFAKQGQEADYHGAITYYLRRKRPQILESFAKKATSFARKWPANYEQIHETLRAGSWMARTIQRKLNDALREEMQDATLNDWLERIWPTAKKLLRHYGEDAAPYTIADDLRSRLLIPRTITIGGKNRYFDLMKALRHRIQDQKS